MNPDGHLTVVHNLKASRFEASLPQGLCHADYRRLGNALHLVHTEVPREVRGRGLAGEVVQAALDYAAESRLKVVPLCGFVRAYMRKHPETHALLAPGARL